MFNGILHVPEPENEAVRSYAPGTADRQRLELELKRQLGEVVEVPMIIDGKEVHSGDLVDICCPHDHSHVIGRAFPTETR